MVTREEISAEITKKVKYQVYTCPDLGAYCLLFKEACRALSKIKFTPTEYQLLLHVLGNSREDNQIYLNTRIIQEELGVCYNSVKEAINGLRMRQILLPVTYGTGKSTGLYKLGNLTNVLNPHIAFQGKLTSAHAKFISNNVPDIMPLQRLPNGNYVNLATGECIPPLGDMENGWDIDV